MHELTQVAQPPLKRTKPAWRIGDPAVIVHTSSGARYEIESDGQLCGGSLNLVRAHLRGARFWTGWVMEGAVVLGERLDVWDNGALDPRERHVTSSTVQRVEPKGGQR